MSTDTSRLLITPLISKPDMGAWGEAQETIWINPYISDFLAKYQTDYDFEDASPWNQ